MAGTIEAAQPFDVDVDELARVAPAIPVRWLERLQPRQPMEPDPGEHVIRNRRNRSITATTRAGVRFAMRLGHDERSARTRSPSRQRFNHS